MNSVDLPHQVVILACFGSAPVGRTLREQAQRYGTIVRLDDRRSIRKEICTRRPSVVLFPLVDQRGTTTRPLVECVLREAPDALAVVCVPPGASTRGLADVLHLGAHVLAWPRDAELHRALDELFVPPPLDEVDQRALDIMLDELVPPSMVDLLGHCTRFAHQRLSVDRLALAFGVSRRTLTRATRRAGWPTPSALIDWGRIARACAIRWRGHDGIADVARLAGFRHSRALVSALRRYVGSDTTLDDLVPLRVNGAIRRAISTGARHDGQLSSPARASVSP